MTPISVAGVLCALALAIAPSALAAETIGEDAALCAAGHGPAIQVNVIGLKDRTGEIWLELYPATQADFLRPDETLLAEGRVFRRTRSKPPVSGEVAICVRVPHPGRFSLMLRHNRIGRDKFSVWSDGAGIAANRSMGRSKPTFEQAAVNAGPGVTVVNIKVQYLRGLGFSAID